MQIKKVRELFFDSICLEDPGQISDYDGYVINEKEFDEKGNLTKECTYNDHGQVEQMNIYTYNDKGFIIQHQIFEGETVLIEERQIEYDEKNRAAKEITKFEEGGESSVEQFFNEENLVEMAKAYEEGEFSGKTVYSYSNGKTVLIETYDADESLLAKKEYGYDENGILESVETQNFETGESQIIYPEYDSEGRLLKETHCVGDKPYFRITQSFNEKGLLVQIVEESQEKGLRKTIISYDKNGNNILQEISNQNDTPLATYIRIYDEKGNVRMLTTSEDFYGGALINCNSVVYEYEYF